MSDSGDGQSNSQVEDFLYTPQGVAVVAVMAAVLVSLVWLSGCVCYCCWRHRHSRSSGPATNQDLFFLGSSNNGTLPVPGSTGAPHFSYSLNSLAMEPAFHHTSLESILSGEIELDGKAPP